MRLRPRLRHGLATWAVLLAIVAAAALMTACPWRHDLTANAANSLSPATVELLRRLPDDIQVTAYVKKGLPLRLQISQLLARYQRHKQNFHYQFIDPDSNPEQARALDIGGHIGDQGVVVVSYQGRSQTVRYLDEQSLTGALSQLGMGRRRWLSFLSGHGERSARGIANFDYGRFSEHLGRRAIDTADLNLAEVGVIPDNSALLVVAAPRVGLMAGELAIIDGYLRQGGNLLLMADPGDAHLAPLLARLRLATLAGAVADGGGKLYGLNDPGFVVASRYPDHPITRNLQLITVYPGVAALEALKPSPFAVQAVLHSGDGSWLETGAVSARATADPGERKGPLPFAYALTRTVNGKEQRVLVVGDSDFLANTYLDNVGNLDMGMRMMDWLLHEDHFIDIPARVAADKTLTLSAAAVALMGFGFLLGVPVLLLAAGTWIWLARRRG